MQPSDKKLIIKDIHVLPKKDITGSKEYAKAAQAAAAEVVVLDPLYSAPDPDGNDTRLRQNLQPALKSARYRNAA